MPCPDGSCGKDQTDQQGTTDKANELEGAFPASKTWLVLAHTQQVGSDALRQTKTQVHPVTPGPVLSSWSFRLLEQHQPGKPSGPAISVDLSLNSLGFTINCY